MGVLFWNFLNEPSPLWQCSVILIVLNVGIKNFLNTVVNKLTYNNKTLIWDTGHTQSIKASFDPIDVELLKSTDFDFKNIYM